MRPVKVVALCLVGSLLLVAIISDFSKAPSTSQSSADGDSVNPSAGEALSAEERAKLEDEIIARVNPPIDTLPTTKTKQTRYGIVEVVEDDDGGTRLAYQGEPLNIGDTESYSLNLGPVWSVGASELLVVEAGSGGTACPSSFILLVVKPEGIFHSKQFGSCSDLVRATQRPDRIILRIGSEAYSVDPTGMRQIRVAEAHSEEAEAEIENPNGDVSNVIRPLIQADMKMYRWCGILEQVNVDDPKNAVFVIALGSREYKFYAISGREEQWKSLSLRIGGPMCVIGRYVSNSEARTVLGVPRTLPVLTAFQISTH
jgi:hypothetical protein